MKSKLLIAVFISLMVSAAEAQKPVQTIPAFSFLKPDKTIFTNAQLPKNKFLFFFCFDPDCDHCQRAASNLNQHYRGYTETQFYMISESNQQKINQFINQYIPAFKNNKVATVLRDAQNEFVTRFQPLHYPAMFLFAKDQKLLDYEDNEESMFRFQTVLKSMSNRTTK